MTGLTVIEPKLSVKLASKLAASTNSTEQDRRAFANALVADVKDAIRKLKGGRR